MSGWISTIIGWLFSHTEATTVFKHLIKVILHNRSPLSPAGLTRDVMVFSMMSVCICVYAHAESKFSSGYTWVCTSLCNKTNLFRMCLSIFVFTYIGHVCVSVCVCECVCVCVCVC